MAESELSLDLVLARLSQARAFSHLPRSELEAIISLGTYRRFTKGEIILQEGLRNSSVYFLLGGSVSVYAGGRMVSRYGRAGDTFGEMSVVSGAPISTTVIANEDLEVLVLDGPAMGRSTVDDDGDITAVFYKLFALSLLEKLRLTTHKASLVEDAIRRFAPPETHSADLAAQVQSVSRHLSDILLVSQAVHTAENGIVLTDVEGRILRLNLAAESLLGCVEIQLAGKPIREICEPASYQAVFPKVIAGQVSSWRGEMTFLRGEGQTFPGQCSISTILNQEGQRVGILVVASDITDKLVLQQRLAQAQNLETMGRMAGGIAHDINNLLQPIIGFAHLALADQTNNKDLARDLEMVLKAAARAKDMVAQLLLFSSQPKLALEAVDLAPIFEECQTMLRLQVGSHVTIGTQLPAGVPPVQADPTQLTRVLINLAVNAGHAMPQGGTITLSASTVELGDYRDRFGTVLTGPHVRISVADTGVGMDVLTLERAFEPFFTTRPHGAGLGLSIVRMLVELHKGGLDLTSRVGHGTTVDLYLPASTQPVAPAVTPGGSTVGHERILYVDDEELVCSLAKSVLERAGYSVQTYLESTEALEAVRAAPAAFDLVITDLTMPRLKGDELARRIRELRPDMPIILCTGYAQPAATSVRGRRLFEDVIRKPVEPSQLCLHVRRVLDRARARAGK